MDRIIEYTNKFVENLLYNIRIHSDKKTEFGGEEKQAWVHIKT
jgi:hypothetical protein